MKEYSTNEWQPSFGHQVKIGNTPNPIPPPKKKKKKRKERKKILQGWKIFKNFVVVGG